MARLEIEVLSKKLIKPSVPTPNHLCKLKLSVFDQLAPKIFSSVIFYYSGSGAADEGEIARRCAGLEKSLSDALVHFYPFAGRFMKDEVSIDCGDQGAEFWRARVSCTLSEFLERATNEVELVDALLPWETSPPADSATVPQLAIQVNAFDDGGIVLALRISHILADAAAVYSLVKTWNSACFPGFENIPGFRHEIADAFPAKSSLSESGIVHPINLELIHQRPWNKIVTRRFSVSSRIITGIKFRAAAGGYTRPLSRLVVVLALVWKSLIGVLMAKHGEIKDSLLSMPLNLRGRTKQTDIAFGNFCIPVVFPFVGNNYKAYNDVDLYDLIGLLRNKMAETMAKIGSASPEELSEMLISSRREVSAKSAGGLDVYFCSSWHGALPAYDTDFGWGKPIWACIGSQPGPGVCVMDYRDDDDGVEMWVSLKQAEMLPFKCHFYDLSSISSL